MAEEKQEKPKEPEEKKNMFQKRPEGASRSELRTAFDKAYSPSGPNIPRNERVKMEKDLFPAGKYGPNISPSDVDKTIKKLTAAKPAAPYAEQQKIQHQIDLLKRLQENT